MRPIIPFLIMATVWLLGLVSSDQLFRRSKLVGVFVATVLFVLVYNPTLSNDFRAVRYPAFVTAIGGFFIALGIEQMWQAKRTTTWGKANGQIITSEVSPAVSVNPNRGTIFQARIEYKYFVDGQMLRSEAISPYLRPQAEYKLYDDAYEIIRPYPKGIPVTVLYNPHEPHESYLDRSVSKSTVCFWLAGAVAILTGVWWAVSLMQV